MQKVITLPEKLIKKGELVLIPRSEYKELLRIAKRQTELDRGLDEAIKEARQGKVVGPFDNARELVKSLSSKSSK